MEQDPVVAALRAAIAEEDSTELRVALGQHLSRKGEHGLALAEHEAALVLDPSSLDALQGAAAAAEAMGDEGKATAYRLAARGRRERPEVVETGRLRVDAEAVLGGTDEPSSSALGETAAPGIRLVAKDGELLDDVVVEERPVVTLKDVGGLDDVKARLERAFLLPLKQPELYKKFGKEIRGGLILYGPPGCGKTYIAKALAGEIGARFLSVGLSDVLDMWLGESERKLHELFENARRMAPTLLFFDEVDALGQRRTQLKHSAGRNVVNQLLSEMDGVGKANRDVFVLGATNHPWDVDPAMRRPGRFDRMLFVSPPDGPARARILELHLEGRLHAEGLDLSRIARATDGFSGADLRAVVDTATDLAIEETVKNGGVERPIDHALLMAAVKDTRPSTRPWFETARNYAVYANEGGSYDELLAYLKHIGLA